MDFEQLKQMLSTPQAQEYLRSAGIGAGLGAGAMGLSHLVNGEEEEMGDRAAGAGRSALLGGLMGGVGGLGVQAAGNMWGKPTPTPTQQSLDAAPPIASSPNGQNYFAARDLTNNPYVGGGIAAGYSAYNNFGPKGEAASKLLSDATSKLTGDKSVMNPELLRNPIDGNVLIQARQQIASAVAANGGKIDPGLINSIRSSLGITDVSQLGDLEKTQLKAVLGDYANQVIPGSNVKATLRNSVPWGRYGLKDFGQAGRELMDGLAWEGDFSKNTTDMASQPYGGNNFAHLDDPLKQGVKLPGGFNVAGSSGKVNTKAVLPSTVTTSVMEGVPSWPAGRKAMNVGRAGLIGAGATMGVDHLLKNTIDRAMMNPEFKNWAARHEALQQQMQQGGQR